MKKITAQEKSATQKRKPAPKKSTPRKNSAPKRPGGAEKTLSAFRKTFRIIICMGVVMVIVAGTALGLKTAHDKYVYSTYPLKYQTEVEAASQKYGVDKFLIYGVIKTESDFDPNAVSPVGAVGLMQIMPETFDLLLTQTHDGYELGMLYDPDTNIKYGTYFLRSLYLRYNDWETVYAAYNAGSGRVDGWLADPAHSAGGKLTDIPIEETEEYVAKVSYAVEKYKELYYDN